MPMNSTYHKWLALIGICSVLLLPSQGYGQFSNSGQLLFEVGGKLPLTRGITTLAGAGGGALTPWATISGNELDRGIGATGHVSHVDISDFSLTSIGAAVGFYDTVELSYSHNIFDTRDAGALLGLGQDFNIKQDVAGLKVRLVGDAVYDQDLWLPQIAAGVQYKRNNRGDLVKGLGANSRDGADFYISATKLFLAQSLLVNGTLRLTKANQTGLLGFGSTDSSGYAVQPEFSVALLLSRRLAVGGEYRFKPNNLGFAKEDDWLDLFAAYAITDNVSLTLAHTRLGSVATFENQNGVYFSLQAGF